MAQTVRPMSLIQKRGYPVTLVFLPPWESIFVPAPAAVASTTSRYSPGLWTVYSISSVTAVSGALPWNEVLLLKSWLRHRFRGCGTGCASLPRTIRDGLALQAMSDDSRFRVIFDCRGINGVEYLYMNGYSPLPTPRKIFSIARCASRQWSEMPDATVML